MKKIKIKKGFVYIGLILLGIVLAKVSAIITSTSSGKMNTEVVVSTIKEFTCAMHPHIRKQEPGNCPICGMELIPVKMESGNEISNAVAMSATAMKLADVQTLVIKEGKVMKSIRLTGKIQPDERFVFSQTSDISGRVDKLLLNYTGELVQKGQVIGYVYSPELVTAQEELLEAYRIREYQPELYEASRMKLWNWKLSEEQIDGILNRGSLSDQFPIHSDVSGVVVQKNVNVGDHIKRGYALFEIADLSKVWVLFDVHEPDLNGVEVGDKVNFSISSVPGEQFKGIISFIDPVINPKTRVARARIEMDNVSDRFKPEMFVTGVIESAVNGDSHTIVIPKSAVMWTGKKSIVYVKTKNENGVYFVLRRVDIGPELEEEFVILNGLLVGDEIAVNGTFAIDAAAQLAGKPSMMNPDDGAKPKGHAHMNMQEK